MDRIRIGIIGTGFIGPAHIEALRRLPQVEVLALAEAGDQVAAEKSAALGIDTPYGDYHALIQDERIDSVHVCSPNHLHYEMVKAALAAGKHVVCEKPLALTVSEADELVELAQEKRLVNAVNFNIRFYPLLH